MVLFNQSECLKTDVIVNGIWKLVINDLFSQPIANRHFSDRLSSIWKGSMLTIAPFSVSHRSCSNQCLFRLISFDPHSLHSNEIIFIFNSVIFFNRLSIGQLFVNFFLFHNWHSVLPAFITWLILYRLIRWILVGLGKDVRMKLLIDSVDRFNFHWKC